MKDLFQCFSLSSIDHFFPHLGDEDDMIHAIPLRVR
jgi:hypothetical protein